MRNRTKHFIYNKKEDFDRGKGGLRTDRGLSGDRNNRIWYSDVMDSGKKGTHWYKICVEMKKTLNAFCRIRVYLSDSSTLIAAGKITEINEAMRSELSDTEKNQMFSAYECMETELTEQVLMRNATGRFLWFSVEFAAAEEFPEIGTIKVYFDCYGWNNYLPEVFKSDDFLQRYLYIFQELYDDMEQKIDHAPMNYNPYCCDREFLDFLSEWLGIRDLRLPDDEKQRILTANAYQLYRKKGTRYAIEKICGLYLGYQPEIIEYYQKDDEQLVLPEGIKRSEVFVDPYVFTVILKGKNLSGERYKGFVKLLDSCKPVYMTANIIADEGQQSGLRLDDTRLHEDGIIGESGIII